MSVVVPISPAPARCARVADRRRPLGDEQDHDGEQDAEVADPGDEERLHRGAAGGLALGVVADEQVRRDAHRLPADEQQGEVVGVDDEHHRRGEERDGGGVRGVAGGRLGRAVVREVADRVDLDAEGDHADRDRDDRRQLVGAAGRGRSSCRRGRRGRGSRWRPLGPSRRTPTSSTTAATRAPAVPRRAASRAHCRDQRPVIRPATAKTAGATTVEQRRRTRSRGVTGSAGSAGAGRRRRRVGRLALGGQSPAPGVSVYVGDASPSSRTSVRSAVRRARKSSRTTASATPISAAAIVMTKIVSDWPASSGSATSTGVDWTSSASPPGRRRAARSRRRAGRRPR